MSVHIVDGEFQSDKYPTCRSSVDDNHGDDAVVSAVELTDDEVRVLEHLRRVDGVAYRLALHQISSRTTSW